METTKKDFLQSVVSIYGPLGYGPSTLPLRHSAIGNMVEVKTMTSNQSRTDTDFVGKKYLSEVGFEPTPSEEDCDLNAAP